MDIDFKEGEYRFLLRCSAVITNREKTKVILFKIKGRDLYMLPGGRINFLEDSYKAIKREMEEELGITSDYKLLCVEENFLLEKKVQNIEFIYHTVVDDIEEIKGVEDKNQEFVVIDIGKINDYDLKPVFLKELIKNVNNDTVIHKINYE